MKTVTDTEIRIRLRGIFAHLRLDMQCLRVCVAGGTVRFNGELNVQGRQDEAVARSVVEALESDVARVKGIRNTYYELKNWRRTGPGEWTPVRPGSSSAATPHALYSAAQIDDAEQRDSIPFEPAPKSTSLRRERVW